MKKLLSIAAIFLMGILAANAQDDKQVNKMMDQLQNGCQMTPDQAAKVKPMVQNFVNVKMQNKKQYADDKTGLKAANESNRKNLKANLLTVLSTTQVGQYEVYVKQQKEEKKEMKSGNNSGSGQQEGE